MTETLDCQVKSSISNLKKQKTLKMMQTKSRESRLSGDFAQPTKQEAA